VEPPAPAAAPSESAPAAPADPLLREMQKAVDDQAHKN
jgi:hypothetical protein